MASKISDDKFQAYLDANPDLLKVNQEPEAKSVKEDEESKSKADGAEEGEAEKEEAPNEEALAEQLEAEKAALRNSWEKDIVAEHLLYVKGVEITMYEFKELLLDLSNILSKQMGTYVAGKPRSILKKFLEENFLKRLSPYIRFCKNISTDEKTAAGATRAWPESEKDKKIRMVVEERKKKEAEEQARLQELAE